MGPSEASLPLLLLFSFGNPSGTLRNPRSHTKPACAVPRGARRLPQLSRQGDLISQRPLCRERWGPHNSGFSGAHHQHPAPFLLEKNNALFSPVFFKRKTQIRLKEIGKKKSLLSIQPPLAYWEVKLLSRVSLWNSMDCSLPGSSVHLILQARTLEWVAISFSRGSSGPRDWTGVSHIACRHFTLWATRDAR